MISKGSKNFEGIGWREVKPKSNKIPEKWNSLESNHAETEAVEHRLRKNY